MVLHNFINHLVTFYIPHFVGPEMNSSKSCQYLIFIIGLFQSISPLLGYGDPFWN